MSLILEALRRSEAERRRGAPPGLLDGAPHLTAAPRPVWPLMLGGVLLGAALAGGLLWWVMGRSAAATDTTTMPVEAPLAADGPPARAPSADLAPPPASTLPPAPIASAAPTAFAASVAPTTSSASETPAAPAAPAELAMASPPPAPSAPDIAGPQDALTGPAAGDVPRANLSAEALPPLRVSMHVFAEAPAQRFVILDGQRVREGDRITDELQVLEIRRDGLRLSWQGRVLWLPR